MNATVRILIVEDRLTDVELAMRELKEVIDNAEFAHTDNQTEFLNLLKNFQPELIISDYEMPSFDGLTVIHLTNEHAPLTPVIIFTGALNEETAADTVKAGAVDYVLKGNAIRLKQAVLQALEKKHLWKEKIEADERLRASEERYRLISSATSDFVFSAIITSGNKLNLTWVAGAFEEITGYPFEELQASGGWDNIIFQDDLGILRNDFIKIHEGQTTITEIRILKKNGESFWVMVSAHPVLDAKTNLLTGIYGAVKDISKRKKAEEEIMLINKNLNRLVKERTKELQVLNNTKDKFFSIIAHDLKGPVAVIITSSEMMLKTLETTPEDKERLKRYSENILRSTQEGYKLLENLLEWSKTQTGAIEYTPTKFNLTERIKECLLPLRLILNNKNIIVQYPEEPCSVYADKNMVDLILRNLISNAIKYSFPGGTISVQISKTKDQVQTSVSDKGIGMSEKTRARLFHIEKKISELGTRNEKGTGLGLILCKEFLDKMGGKIWVESKEGKGSTFNFTLPIKRQE